MISACKATVLGLGAAYQFPIVSANCRKKKDSSGSVSMISDFWSIEFVEALPLAFVQSSDGVRACAATIAGKCGKLSSVPNGAGETMKSNSSGIFESRRGTSDCTAMLFDEGELIMPEVPGGVATMARMQLES